MEPQVLKSVVEDLSDSALPKSASPSSATPSVSAGATAVKKGDFLAPEKGLPTTFGDKEALPALEVIAPLVVVLPVPPVVVLSMVAS